MSSPTRGAFRPIPLPDYSKQNPEFWFFKQIAVSVPADIELSESLNRLPLAFIAGCPIRQKMGGSVELNVFESRFPR
jgi:hypothetical protein